MRLLLLRSAWGLGEVLRADAPRAIERLLVDQGFDGLEASLTDIGADAAQRRRFLRCARERGVRLVLSAYSSWPNYEGPFDSVSTREQHEARLLGEIAAIAELHAEHGGVVGINAHSGRLRAPGDRMVLSSGRSWRSCLRILSG